MPHVADYVVITDKPEKMVRGGTNFFERNFTIPQNFSRDFLAVIHFMADTDDNDEPDGLHYILRINGQDVASYTHSDDRFGTFHEAFPSSAMHPGENNFTAVATQGEGTMHISDVYVQFKVLV